MTRNIIPTEQDFIDMSIATGIEISELKEGYKEFLISQQIFN
jgi:hypothetical protein